MATTSKGRLDLVSKLLEQGNKRFLLEKMVCQSKTEYIKIISKMKKHKSKAWINTPRRYFKSYQKINNIFSHNIVHLCVDAGNLGLGSNAIHIMDLFSWLNHDYDISLNGDYLDNKILSNKRGKNFVEFSGSLIGKSKKGALLYITFHLNQNIPVTVTLVNKNMKIIIDETNSKLLLNTESNTLNFNTEFVSNITDKIAFDILNKDSCLLPKLENSLIAHTELFKVFNRHLTKIQKIHYNLCPIT